MNGLTFLIWQLRAMPPVEQVINLLILSEAKAVSIKVANGVYKFNVGDGEQPLKNFINSLKSAGFEVGGWHYLYPGNEVEQGRLATERVLTLGLDHYLLDAEGEWKGGTGKPALLCDQLPDMPIGLCSYRYPAVHPTFPWYDFLSHHKVTFNAPQVYWVGAHNPDEQLIESNAQFKSLPAVKPYCPIGSAYGGGDWLPTVEDFTKFVDTCEAKDFVPFGFYSLDWTIAHQHGDWLQAIAKANDEVPIPPPPPTPSTFVVANCTWANVRSDGDAGIDNRIAILKAGSEVEMLEHDVMGWDHVRVTLEGWIFGDYVVGSAIPVPPPEPPPVPPQPPRPPGLRTFQATVTANARTWYKKNVKDKYIFVLYPHDSRDYQRQRVQIPKGGTVLVYKDRIVGDSGVRAYKVWEGNYPRQLDGGVPQANNGLYVRDVDGRFPFAPGDEP